MRIDGLEIEDEFADELLSAFGAEAADFTDPARRREALELLILHGLELLERQVTAPEGASLRAELEAALLSLAGSPHLLPVEADRRGVPHHVWTPRSGWLSLAAAPSRWTEHERLLTELRELIEEAPHLRIVATARRLATNEELTEISFLGSVEPVTFEARMNGRRYRFKLAPDSVFVSGIPLSDPEPVVEERH